MRKWTALLLALLLAVMPVATLAENYEIKIKYDVDGEALTPVLTQVMEMMAQQIGTDMVASVDAAEVARITELLLDATSFTIHYQPDGVRITCNMQDQYLCSVFVSWNETEIALCTNFLPNLKLTLPLNTVQDALADLATVDWAQVGEDAASRAVRWFAALQASESHGSFGGDAYTGGAKRVMYHITDADIADLMDSLLLGVEGNDALMALLRGVFGEKELTAALRDFREFNVQVRQESQYRYDFSRVYTEKDVLIGLSLNVLEGDELIATASLGADEAGERGALVVSIPLGSGIVYVDAQLILGEKLYGSFAVYQSGKMVSYQHAQTDASLLVQRQTVEIAYTPGENGYVMEINTNYTGAMNQRGQVLQLVVDEPYSMVQTATNWYGDSTKPVTVSNIMVKTYSNTVSFQEGLQPIDLTRLGEDAVQLDALEKSWAKGLQQVTVTLFKVLPAELLTTFMMMTK